nr:hypothetical protein BaRGS_013625 [Batillaria attramentaria]
MTKVIEEAIEEWETYTCLNFTRKSTVIHEIGHAIGWIHEHARPERDDYIYVNYPGIPEVHHSQFKKFSAELVDDCGVQYDYRSIMHYGGDEPVPMSMKTVHWKYQDIIGMGEGLSYKDAKLANLMYSCAGSES